MKSIFRSSINIIFIIAVSTYSSGVILSDSINAYPDEIISGDCTINEEVFERQWRNYADINDERVPSQSKSLPAQRYHRAAEEYLKLKLELHELQSEMAIHAQMRKDARETKNALVRNIRQNLLKSFVRLSYFTATTINDTAGLGSSFKNLISSGAAASTKIASATKIFRNYTPQQSQLALSNKKTSSKLASLGLTAALEISEGLSDPAALANTMTKDFNSKFLPSVNLDEQEFALLRNQREFNEALDRILRESYVNAREMNEKAKTLSEKLGELRIEMDAAANDEKQRIRDMFIDECRKKKKTQTGSSGNSLVSLQFDKYLVDGHEGSISIQVDEEGALTGTFVFRSKDGNQVYAEWKGSFSGEGEIRIDRQHGGREFHADIKGTCSGFTSVGKRISPSSYKTRWVPVSHPQCTVRGYISYQIDGEPRNPKGRAIQIEVFDQDNTDIWDMWGLFK